MWIEDLRERLSRLHFRMNCTAKAHVMKIPLSWPRIHDIFFWRLSYLFLKIVNQPKKSHVNNSGAVEITSKVRKLYNLSIWYLASGIAKVNEPPKKHLLQRCIFFTKPSLSTHLATLEPCFNRNDGEEVQSINMPISEIWNILSSSSFDTHSLFRCSGKLEYMLESSNVYTGPFLRNLRCGSERSRGSTWSV